MKKSHIVDSTCNDMRIDRWIRHSLGKIPQGLIEKNLRAGKIKLNKKKIKSSHKIKTNDQIDIFNINEIHSLTTSTSMHCRRFWHWCQYPADNSIIIKDECKHRKTSHSHPYPLL